MSMTENIRYSRLELLFRVGSGYFFGVLNGILTGVVGSLAVPTSLISINKGLDRNIDDIFVRDGPYSAYDKLGDLTFHYARLMTRIGIHGTAMYKMMEDISNGGDMSYALLAVPNLISAGYEIHRYTKKEE